MKMSVSEKKSEQDFATDRSGHLPDLMTSTASREPWQIAVGTMDTM